VTVQTEQIRDLIDKMEERVGKKLDKVGDKIDKLADVSSANAIKLAENTVSLVDHIRRTELLEEEMRLSKLQLKDTENKHYDMEKKVSFLINLPRYIYILIKWSAAISASSGAVYAIVKLIATIKL